MTTMVYPATMSERLAQLESARVNLMAELEQGAFDAQYAEEGRWSVAEIAYHLYLVESRITGLLKQLLGANQQGERAGEEVLRREWELIHSRATDPEVRSTAPAPVVPQDAPPLAKSIELLKDSRAQLLAAVSQATIDELASVSAPHPLEVIGTLTGAGWLSLIGQHEFRHTRQIRNLKAKMASA